MAIDTKRLMALLQIGTPLPWRSRWVEVGSDPPGPGDLQRVIVRDQHEPTGSMDGPVVGLIGLNGIDVVIREQDATLIVEAMNALPELLRELEMLRAEVDHCPACGGARQTSVGARHRCLRCHTQWSRP